LSEKFVINNKDLDFSRVCKGSKPQHIVKISKKNHNIL